MLYVFMYKHTAPADMQDMLHCQGLPEATMLLMLLLLQARAAHCRAGRRVQHSAPSLGGSFHPPALTSGLAPAPGAG